MTASPAIQILPQAVANQIAAGEVVERPASVIKELCENAIDAQATNITVEIEQGGTKRCTVIDNGIGINRNCLAKTVLPHATSKIRHAEDLFHINSLGFRGEALASISAVSRFRIASRVVDEEHGYQLTVIDNLTSEISSTAHPLGTTVDVSDLFYNLPVRKAFLKREKTEYHQLQMMMRAIALSHPEVAITLISDGRPVWRLPAANDEQGHYQRIYKLLGKSFVEHALSVSVECDQLQLSGWIADPSYLRSQQDQQYLFLNGRVVRDRLLLRAIREVYQPYLYPGRQACFVLYLQLPKTSVDINVHPTKHEVRFQDPLAVHEIICQHLQGYLQVDDLRTSNGANQSTQSSTTEHVNEVSPVTPSSAALPAKPDQPTPYLAITSGYGLLPHEQGQILFDLNACYRQWLLQKARQLLAAEDVLPSRPLLVPVTLSTTTQDLSLNRAAAATLGFALDPIADRQWLVRTTPLMMPYIDLDDLLSVFGQLEQTVAHYLQQLLSRQTVSHQQLDDKQKQVLAEQIHQHLHDSQWLGCCRLLDDCHWQALIRD